MSIFVPRFLAGSQALSQSQIPARSVSVVSVRPKISWVLAGYNFLLSSYFTVESLYCRITVELNLGVCNS